MKMELVLSSAGPEASPGEPYKNEDVREWSRLDRLTGMLERARVETGRWRADTEDASQSYGKMVDSRERNSADGSLVQKARRQVEIFQSQGTGGRSFQVVRASQWSSSRATDCGFDNALADKPAHNPESANGGVTTATSNGSAGGGGGVPQPAPRLSLWRSTNLASDPTSPSADLERLSSLCRRLHDEALSQQLWAPEDEPQPLARSNSNEDVSSLIFDRDSKLRRSLAENGVKARPRNELIAERARRFEANGDGDAPRRPNFVGAKSFAPIADNDFVKNDPKHPSKTAKSPSPPAPLENGHATVPPVPAARKANNRTVVLLRTSPKTGQETTLVNGTAKPVKKVEFCKTELHFAADSGKVNIVETDGKPPPTNKFRRRRRNHGLNAQKQTAAATTAVGGAGGNLPLVHFGDTSYEKYIFGGQGKPPPENHHQQHQQQQQQQQRANKKPEDNNSIIAADENTQNGGDADKKEPRERIDAHNADDQRNMRDFDSYSGSSSSCSGSRVRANHTTTVNFLKEESSASGAGGNHQGLRNVQLQFGGRSLSPLDGADDECSVNRTTKITVRLPAADDSFSSDEPPARIGNGYSNLESVRLVKGIDRSLLGDEPQSRSQQCELDGANSLRELLTKLYGKEIDVDVENFKFRDFKRTRDKRLLEIKDALDKSRKRLDKKLSAASTEKSGSSGLFTSQVALKDLDKYTRKEPTNPVLLKVLASHKPILARLENDRGFNASFRNHLKKTKDDCDNKPNRLFSESLFADRIPVYENIFDAISDGPLYENFNHSKVKKSPESKKKATTTTGTSQDKKPATKKPVSKAPEDKVRRSATPTIASEAKRTVPRSREASVKRQNGKVGAKDTDTKRKSSLKSNDSGGVKSVSSSNSETLKKKKPVEVVYQTAVYNMKNEKLSKQSAKAKEAKGPRLINDLICGSKMKRPADKKVKAAVVSQNTSKRKETSSTMNR